MRIAPFQYLALAAAILSCSSVHAANLEGGAVAAPDQYGAQVAADILKKGGNAVDAAVATAFTLAVTYPEAGNIGGGGFMTLFVDGKPYFLGIFLTGAYQDIMGDLHNLFGRVNEVHVFLEDDEPNGFYIEEALSGSRIADVIEGVQYQQEELCRKMKGQIDNATRRDQVKPREGVRLLELYESQMLNKTYLNIERSTKKKK